MTMKALREQQREQQRVERLRLAEDLIAQTGSVRQAAKLAGMRRPNFIRLRNTMSPRGDILQSPAPPATK